MEGSERGRRVTREAGVRVGEGEHKKSREGETRHDRKRERETGTKTKRWRRARPKSLPNGKAMS